MPIDLENELDTLVEAALRSRLLIRLTHRPEQTWREPGPKARVTKRALFSGCKSLIAGPPPRAIAGARRTVRRLRGGLPAALREPGSSGSKSARPLCGRGEQDAPSRVTGISFSLSIFTNIVVFAGKRFVVATHLRPGVVNLAEVGVAVGVLTHEWTTANFVAGFGTEPQIGP